METDMVGFLCKYPLFPPPHVSFLMIQIRDQQSSAALGLPSRIRDEDCDVAMLEAKDIEDEHSVENQDIFGVQRTEHVSYPIEMTKLARLCMNPAPCSKTVTDNIISARNCFNTVST